MYETSYMENGFFCFSAYFMHADASAKEVIRINSFMAWVGGKKALRNEILARFPLDYIKIYRSVRRCGLGTVSQTARKRF